MADLAELQKKQADAASFAMRMVEEKDPELLKQMAERVRESCVELANMAKALEAAMTPAGASGPETRVALTPEQRKRVAEQTGVGVVDDGALPLPLRHDAESRAGWRAGRGWTAS